MKAKKVGIGAIAALALTPVTGGLAPACFAISTGAGNAVAITLCAFIATMGVGMVMALYKGYNVETEVELDRKGPRIKLTMKK